MKELTVSGILLGVILGILFGASSLYLALKVGMTVSASIPVAVLSITLFRALSKVFKRKPAGILENNMVQTTGSAGESIAFGIAVTMPALLILGYDLDLTRIMTVAVLGGLLGVLMMIPLRHALIVKEHGKLIYPEGTACAEVLKVGESSGLSAKTVFSGFFAGLFYKVFNVGFKLWKDVPEKEFAFFKGSAISAEVSPELLGVGYIIGPRIAATMVGGGVLSAWVFIPMIKLFGDGLTTPLFPATKLIREMALHEIWRNYVLYIGAGAVAAGGIISLLQSLPTIVRSIGATFKTVKGDISKSDSLEASEEARKNRDLPMWFVVAGVVGLVIAIWLNASLHLNLLGAILIVAFGFLFVAVSSRLTGEIGSSSNPISGMTVATLLLTCLIFLLMGWVGNEYRVTALSIAAIVCVAASNGGTTSQDLKTGYLVGATPMYQQIGLLIGALTSALVIGYSLKALNDASTIYSKKEIPAGLSLPLEKVSQLKDRQHVLNGEYAHDTNEYLVYQLPDEPRAPEFTKLKSGKYLVADNGALKYFVDPGINGALTNRDDGVKVVKYEAPKARLMSLIIDGILTSKLPWGLVLLGVAISIVLELCGIPSLAFAVGVYLPLSASTPIFVGGMVRGLCEKLSKKKVKTDLENESSPGVLYSSGLIAGGSIAGIVLAILSVREGWAEKLDLSRFMESLSRSDGFAALVFLLLSLSLVLVGLPSKKESHS